MSIIDWDKYQNFTEEEFRCRCSCGETKVTKQFMDALQALRSEFGKPMTITSGYRCEEHPVEKIKPVPGSHAQGKACDILIKNGRDRYQLVTLARKHGFVGIGVSDDFVHLDVGHEHGNRPAMWTY